MWNKLRCTDQCEISHNDVLEEEPFNRMLSLEQKRSDRSKRNFALMLLEPAEPNCEGALTSILRALPAATRDTDITGWYKARSIIGVICTETGAADNSAIERALLTKVSTVLHKTLKTGDLSKVRLSFQLFRNANDGTVSEESVFTLCRELMWNNRPETHLAIDEALDLEAAT